MTLEQAQLLLEERERGGNGFDNAAPGSSELSESGGEDEACTSDHQMDAQEDEQFLRENVSTPIVSNRGLSALSIEGLPPPCIFDSPSTGKSSEPSISPIGLKLLITTN